MNMVLIVTLLCHFPISLALNRCISIQRIVCLQCVYFLQCAGVRSLLGLQLVFRSYRLLIIWKMGLNSLYRVSAVVVVFLLLLCFVFVRLYNIFAGGLVVHP